MVFFSQLGRRDGAHIWQTSVLKVNSYGQPQPRESESTVGSVTSERLKFVRGCERYGGPGDCTPWTS